MSALSGRTVPFEFETLTEPQWFERSLRFAIVRLRQAGFPEQQHATVLRHAIDRLARIIFDGVALPWDYVTGPEESLTFEEVWTRKIARCFQAGYYPDKISQYDLLEEHGLIAWDPERTNWTLTTLGAYAKDLRPFSLLLFLLSIQLSLSRQRRRGRYLTPAVLRHLIAAGPGQRLQRRENPPYSLVLFGVVEMDEDHERSVTDFGFQLLTAVQEKETELRDLVLLLLELEAHGFKVPEAQLELGDDVLAALGPHRPSLAEVERLANLGRFLQALKLLFPTIEAFLNSLLEEEGRSPSDFRGMRQKYEELTRAGRISRQIGYWGEVFVARNKILHGNIRDDNDNLCEPLYRLVARFLATLVRQSRGHLGADSSARYRTTRHHRKDTSE